MEKVMDPSFQAGVKGYVSEAGKKAGEVGKSANSWSKQTFGVDVAEQVGGVVGSVKDKIAGPDRRGYGALSQEYEGETSDLYQDEDDFFAAHGAESGSQGFGGGLYGSTSHGASTTQQSAPEPTKKQDDWDEWKDF